MAASTALADYTLLLTYPERVALLAEAWQFSDLKGMADMMTYPDKDQLAKWWRGIAKRTATADDAKINASIKGLVKYLEEKKFLAKHSV